MSEIDTLIFDLGNVVIRHDDELLARKMAEMSSASIEDIYKAWGQTRNPFQRGEVEPREFFERFSEIIGGFDGSYEDFRQVVCSHFSRNEEMEQLVEELAETDYKIALLSNTNEIHYSFIEDNFPVVELFDPVVLSFRVGARKPEEEIFNVALERADSRPEEAVFIDNKEENARAAVEAGIKGAHFVGKEELVEDLGRLGVDLGLIS